MRHFKHYFYWWLEGLLYFVPVGLRAKFQSTSSYLQLQINQAHLIANHYDGKTLECLTEKTIPIGDEEQLKLFRDWLADLKNDNVQIVMCFDEDSVLSKSLRLPLAAKDSLREVLAFELERQTPFSLEQVIYHHRLIESSSDSKKIEVILYLVRKKDFEEKQLKLQQLGINLQMIAFAGAEICSTDLILDLNRESEKSRVYPVYVPISAIILLFLLALYLPIYSQERHIEEMESHVGSRMVEAKKQLLNAKKETRSLSRYNSVESEYSSGFSAIELLNELTRVLPTDTWSNRISMRDDEIQFQGESGAASSIISLVEDSLFFENTRFRSPVTRNGNSQKDRFNASASILKRIEESGL